MAKAVLRSVARPVVKSEEVPADVTLTLSIPEAIALRTLLRHVAGGDDTARRYLRTIGSALDAVKVPWAPYCHLTGSIQFWRESGRQINETVRKFQGEDD